MPDAIHIRPAAPADAPVIAEYNAAMALETEHKRLDPATLRAGVEWAVAHPDAARYFLAEVAGQVVAQLMITFEWSDWRNAMFWWVQSVYVHPDFRSRGVFGTLYRHVEVLAREARACGLRLYVEKDNARAQEVYRRLGMSDAGYLVYESDWSGCSQEKSGRRGPCGPRPPTPPDVLAYPAVSSNGSTARIAGQG